MLEFLKDIYYARRRAKFVRYLDAKLYGIVGTVAATVVVGTMDDIPRLYKVVEASSVKLQELSEIQEELEKCI